MVNVEQLKSSVNRMSADVVRNAVNELRLDGLVTEGKTPFSKVHFNTCFAEIEALFQRAGYHKQLDVVGYQGLLYALYDPGRWEAVDVLRWLKEFTEAASASPILRAELAKP
ncbi:transcriptional regulator [Pseudomonas syringae]|uniref:Transcriptional regulator n=1 Tax=Pseudomonas syringae TaxID=317 RepID=A0A9Q3X104_PSESX|nr:transcriptional regulator [Pseudomonas syringae]MCF5063096.1 transcriptional regulator [Pseudomonas syringae]MCF5074976.1 transcriptional regulator [Pseudomonas syringae]MCF5120661.1 transcriptional regulator [Pseudomonas syringae]MCF5380818.1 transcriptional regulator [Pseudomonas syringae]